VTKVLITPMADATGVAAANISAEVTSIGTSSRRQRSLGVASGNTTLTVDSESGAVTEALYLTKGNSNTEEQVYRSDAQDTSSVYTSSLLAKFPHVPLLSEVQYTHFNQLSVRRRLAASTLNVEYTFSNLDSTATTAMETKMAEATFTTTLQTQLRTALTNAGTLTITKASGGTATVPNSQPTAGVASFTLATNATDGEGRSLTVESF
jgi:hypothetical protein